MPIVRQLAAAHSKVERLCSRESQKSLLSSRIINQNKEQSNLLRPVEPTLENVRVTLFDFSGRGKLNSHKLS